MPENIFFQSQSSRQLVDYMLYVFSPTTFHGKTDLTQIAL
ncbi:hypothetical protein SNSL317_A2975 [Salmonella enterica subsp. enterica serovar Newport str. SL317]|nr:hypothetical protein SNSL317_A2975 [Salmonella enterica subsp. enterica serovar Newport str. SL317]